MKKFKNLIIVLLVIALLIGADAVIMKKVISDKPAEEKIAETVSDTTAEKTSEIYSEDNEDNKEDDKYYDMDIEDFMTEYCSDKENHIIKNVAENRVGCVFINKNGIGFAEGDITAGAGRVYGKLLKTTNGGKTWKTVQNSINSGRLVYIDDTLIQFRYVRNGYCSEVNLFDSEGNHTKYINLSNIFGMTDEEKEYSFDVVADVIECREHSVIVGWRLSSIFLNNQISDYDGDFAGEYDSYVYIGEYDSDFNEIEQIYKNKELLDKIKV